MSTTPSKAKQSKAPAPVSRTVMVEFLWLNVTGQEVDGLRHAPVRPAGSEERRGESGGRAKGETDRYIDG